jgi:hypothetical protein
MLSWLAADALVINRRGGIATREMMTTTIGAYQAMYFENVAQAVEYCNALVPHLVPRAGASRAADDPAVVWFHVPARGRNSTRDGCYLFASTGAIAAAERACLDTPLCGRVTRAALPSDAVLLFGDDAPAAPPRGHVSRRANGARPTRSAAGITPSPTDLRV